MSDQNRKATIYDIAQLCGCSPSTVSAVLSGRSQARRIKTSTREHIEKIATEVGYSTNMQARGLRRARSGLIGMIIPIHDNRFFSSLSQSFDSLARERGLVPVIASTLRNADEERRIADTLISYAVDALVICGATDPDAVGKMCGFARIPHVFVDLPGKSAPSVVTDNIVGAERMTRNLLARMPKVADKKRARPYFFGGFTKNYPTARRVEAFKAVCAETGLTVEADQIIECGYSPRSAADAMRGLYRQLGGLPAALFINSLTAFEGAMSLFAELPAKAFNESAIGSFDYDPFAEYLQFPVCMVRQDTKKLIATAYDLLERSVTDPITIKIEPELIEPRAHYRGPISELG